MRPDNFPSSVVLCGLVDVKDYKIHRSDGEINREYGLARKRSDLYLE